MSVVGGEPPGRLPFHSNAPIHASRLVMVRYGVIGKAVLVAYLKLAELWKLGAGQRHVPATLEA